MKGQNDGVIFGYPMILPLISGIILILAGKIVKRSDLGGAR
ncbi:MAG: hypothetical protein ACFE96_12990 [Candidatus Hermodarchaeota archaeon]